jgi:hypothetical protein
MQDEGGYGQICRAEGTQPIVTRCLLFTNFKAASGPGKRLQPSIGKAAG